MKKIKVMTMGDVVIIKEIYRDTLIKKIKDRLRKLIYKEKRKYYDKWEEGFQDGWNELANNLIDIDLDQIK